MRRALRDERSALQVYSSAARCALGCKCGANFAHVTKLRIHL